MINPFVKLTNILKITVISMISILLLMTTLYLLIKFWHKNIFDSIRLEQALKLEINDENDQITNHINSCVGRATVQYISPVSVILHIPTKRYFEIGSKANIRQLIKERINSEEFRETINDILPNYRFESKTRYHKDEFTLKGTRIYEERHCLW